MSSLRSMHRIALVAAVAGGFAAAGVPAVAAPSTSAAAASHVQGRVVSVSGNTLVLRLRDGREEHIDITVARAAHHTGLLAANSAVTVRGSRDASGTFHAVSIGHASPDSKQWSPDD
jgi:hypothetical protein